MQLLTIEQLSEMSEMDTADRSSIWVEISPDIFARLTFKPAYEPFNFYSVVKPVPNTIPFQYWMCDAEIALPTIPDADNLIVLRPELWWLHNIPVLGVPLGRWAQMADTTEDETEKVMLSKRIRTPGVTPKEAELNAFRIITAEICMLRQLLTGVCPIIGLTYISKDQKTKVEVVVVLEKEKLVIVHELKRSGVRPQRFIYADGDVIAISFKQWESEFKPFFDEWKFNYPKENKETT